MSGIMSIGTRAMFANYAALQTVGNNIANANTEGYSRQEVDLETAGGQSTGAGFFGRGVNVKTVTRSSDQFLTTEAANAASQSAHDDTRLTQMQRLEDVFGTGKAGIGQAAGDVLNAFVDVGNRPQDTSARQVVLARAEELASRFNNADQQLSDLQSGVTQDIKNSVGTVNNLAAQVAAINQQIAAARGTGNQPNDLLDQRDLLVKKIGEKIQVTSIAADDGSVGLFIGGGQRLVLGNQSNTLAVVPDSFDPARVTLAVKEAGTTRALDNASLAGGSMSALLEFQNKDLQDARGMIGQMATAIAGAVNKQQALGLDLGQPPSSGSPLLAVGSPRVLPASTNARAADGSFLATTTDAQGRAVPTVSITITDTKQLQPSDYTLRSDPANPGTYIVTRESDGLTRSVIPGETIDGFTVGMSLPAPGINDRYVLQPVSQAGGGMRRALDDPKGIAAASPVTATVGADNKGTAAVASLTVVDKAIDPTQKATVSFTDDAGGYSWELRDASDTVTSSGTGTWTSSDPIKLNGFELKLSGLPKSGDTVSVSKTLYPAANNGNALALVALRDDGIVGEQTLSDGSIVPGETITDAYARSMADVGVRVQGAKAANDLSTAVQNTAETAKSSQSGVNLDEEAARLIQFQQGYQAAAKVLQVAQSVFDTLLNAASR